MAQPLQVIFATQKAAESSDIFGSQNQRRELPTHEAPPRAEEAAPGPARSGAADAEFDRRKRLHVGRSEPIVSLAAFLVATSRQNRHEGRDAALVGDDLQSGAVADFLGLDVDTVSRALLSLRDQGLIEPDEGSLRLRDIDGLQRLVDFNSQSVKSAPGTLSAHVINSSRLNWGESVLPSVTSELREVSWLLFLMAGLSVISVGFGVIVAIALF